MPDDLFVCDYALDDYIEADEYQGGYEGPVCDGSGCVDLCPECKYLWEEE